MNIGLLIMDKICAKERSHLPAYQKIGAIVMSLSTYPMNNEERLQKLKHYINELDALIALEVRNLRHKPIPLKTEDFKNYYKLTKRRNILLNNCITVLEKMTDLNKNAVDKLIKPALAGSSLKKES